MHKELNRIESCVWIRTTTKVEQKEPDGALKNVWGKGEEKERRASPAEAEANSEIGQGLRCEEAAQNEEVDLTRALRGWMVDARQAIPNVNVEMHEQSVNIAPYHPHH
jgi:hypothetical protein